MCPTCKQPMIVVELEGVEVDYCLTCHGTWLDAGELELITELAGGQPGPLHRALDVAGRGRPGVRRCPRCRRKLRLITVGQTPAIEVDRCPHGHGVWLDVGELATLVREYAPQAGHAVARFLGELLRHTLTGETEKG
jgi:Zn-finger nucleic acid-binding protein